MKTLLYFLAVLFTALALPARADDKVDSYDATKSVLVLDRGGILKSFHLTRFTEFTINGERADFAKLTPGLVVTVSLSDPQTLSRIVARNAALSKATGHSFVLKMLVDGSDIVRVKDGALTIEHKSWDRPQEIFINGVEWKPTWNGNMTEPYKAFDPPLLPFGQSKPVLKQVSGRSRVFVEHVPGGDSAKIFALRFNDEDPGADTYEVHISWATD